MEPLWGNGGDYRWEFRYLQDHITESWRKPWKNRRYLPPKHIRGGWRTGRTPYFRYKMRRNRRKYLFH